MNLEEEGNRQKSALFIPVLHLSGVCSICADFFKIQTATRNNAYDEAPLYHSPSCSTWDSSQRATDTWKRINRIRKELGLSKLHTCFLKRNDGIPGARKTLIGHASECAKRHTPSMEYIGRSE